MEDYLTFHGMPSVLFEQLEAGNEEGVRHLEIVREYGSHQKLEDGTELPLFQWMFILNQQRCLMMIQE